MAAFAIMNGIPALGTALTLALAKTGPLGINTGGRGLIVGLFIGIVFGFLIQKARLAKFCVIVDFFRLKDVALSESFACYHVAYVLIYRSF